MIGFYTGWKAVEHIGDRIRTRRKELGYSQVTLAKTLGIQQSQLSHHERGEAPKMETLVKLANVLNCTVDWLVGRSPIPEGTLAELNPVERDLIGAIREGRPGDEIRALQLRAAEYYAAENRKADRKR